VNNLFTISPSGFRWLEGILSSRFNHVWNLSETPFGLLLSLKGRKEGILFDNLQKEFSIASSDLPFSLWDAQQEGWSAPLKGPLPAPGVEKLMVPLIELREHQYVIHYDIMGLTYWMLNRIEEIGREDLDVHNRFPAVSSHAFKHKYIERPIVDEWLNVLGQVILLQWPDITLKKHSFKMQVSHDVDVPSLYGFLNWKTFFRCIFSNVLKRFDIRNAITITKIRLNTRDKIHLLDPANTFKWIMDISDELNLHSTFYFISGNTNSKFDADYEIDHKAIRALIKYIHIRGHEIGLHPSYNTYLSSKEIISELDRLKKISSDEGVKQIDWGVRMHYLRWKHPITLNALEEAKISYDNSLTYADHPGFRCGTCFEYRAFDPINQHELEIIIRPLILMENSLIDEVYLGLGIESVGRKKAVELKDKCKGVSGVFSILWHNSSFQTSKYKEFYKFLLRA
jgi:hypothetical protein